MVFSSAELKYDNFDVVRGQGQVVMKNKHNKRGLSRLLCTFNLGCWVTVDSIHDGVFGHDEADITNIRYMLQAADDGCHVVRVIGLSLMTRTYSCCLSTGHGAVMYRIVSQSTWRSVTVFS